MERKTESALWFAVAGLAFALLSLDPAPQPAWANDSAGRVATLGTRGSFFIVDTDNQWIGLYAQPGNSGPRLISAQNYQYATVMAAMRADSEKMGCETATGWNLPQTVDGIQAEERAQRAQR